MHKLVRFLLALLFFLSGLLNGIQAYGEDSPVKKRAPLSQLKFDDSPRKVVKEPKVKPPEPTPPTDGSQNTPTGNVTPTEQSKPPNANAGSSVVQIYKETADEVASYPTITPKLREGPQTDQSDQDKITSLIKWQRAGSNSCKTPGDERNYCMKAAALREVLFRFSGNNDFYDSHCYRPCDKPGYKGVINMLKLDSQRGEEFRVNDPVQDCSFSFSKVAGRHWMFLKVAEVECVCVPQNCESK